MSWAEVLGPLAGAIGGAGLLSKLIEWRRGRHLDEAEVAAKRAEIEAGLDERWSRLLDRITIEAEQLRDRVTALDSEIAVLRAEVASLQAARRLDAEEITRLRSLLISADIDPGGNP